MKKCLVLDLDNTLWGGVVGEDGMDGILLSHKGPGASFVAFQQAILDLHTNGVILAINSRNNEADALKVIREHPNMILKEPHFAARRTNWNDKAQNMRELAQELNIGLDSFVFLDDDASNRALVRALLPEVETPELPDNPAEYTQFLMSLPHFASSVTTNEDLMRGNYYVTERLRKEAENEFASKEEFLKSLNITVHLARNDEPSVPRIAQLTGKTNQFNVLKREYTEDEIRGFMASPTHAVYHGKVTDRFGDYGITAVALVSKGTDAWHLVSLLLSCRVLGRGVEHAFVRALAEEAEKNGVRVLTSEFARSEKNAPAEEFVTKHFSPSGTIYQLNSPLPSAEWVTLRYATI